MDKNRIRTQLIGIAALNGILIAETEGSGYWFEWTKELNTLLLQGGDELMDMYREVTGESDTEEFAPLTNVNLSDTREIPAVRMYDEIGNEVEALKQRGTYGG